MSDIVLTEVHGGIATITLNRPDARNALSSDLIRALRSAVHLGQDDVGHVGPSSGSTVSPRCCPRAAGS